MKRWKLILLLFAGAAVASLFYSPGQELVELRPYNPAVLQNGKAVQKIEDSAEVMAWKKDIFKPLKIEIPAVSVEKTVEVTVEKPAVMEPVAMVEVPAIIPPPQLVLTGILESASGNLAIVNRQIVREGDLVSDSEILSIDADSVTVSRIGKKYRFMMQK